MPFVLVLVELGRNLAAVEHVSKDDGLESGQGLGGPEARVLPDRPYAEESLADPVVVVVHNCRFATISLRKPTGIVIVDELVLGHEARLWKRPWLVGDEEECVILPVSSIGVGVMFQHA